MIPKIVETKGAITAIISAAYLRITCQVGASAGNVEALIGLKNSASKNPQGRIAAPTIANLDNCLSWGSFSWETEALISYQLQSLRVATTGSGN